MLVALDGSVGAEDGHPGSFRRMETLRYMYRALREGFRRWFSSPQWAAVTGISTLLGATIGVANFWSLDYVWHWTIALLLVILFMMGSGAYSLADEQAEEATALIAERDSLISERDSVMAERNSLMEQLAAATFRGSVDLTNVVVEDAGGGGIRTASNMDVVMNNVQIRRVGGDGISSVSSGTD